MAHITLKSFLFKIILIVFSLSLGSCMPFDGGDGENSNIQTDLIVKITVRDNNTKLPVPNQEFNWMINFHNITTNTDDTGHSESGNSTTNADGEFYLPTYQCLMNAGYYVYVLAFTSPQNQQSKVITFSEVRDAAGSESYVELEVEHTIYK